MPFTSPIFMKLLSTHRHCMGIAYTEFFPGHETCRKQGKLSFMSFSVLCLPLYEFSRNSLSLNGIT
jgi:hypothetical protein